MKVRDSGMPDKQTWEGFFSPDGILDALGLNTSVRDTAEFGCGYGTFTIPAAKKISGKLFAFDIEPEMVKATQAQAVKSGVNNLDAKVRDFLAEGTGLGAGSVDYVMLFNILHLEDPASLLREANRILKVGGRAGIIHWNYDPSTPRGPAMSIRPKPTQCIEWAVKSGFTSPKQSDLKPHHYGIVMTKKE